MAKCTTCGRTIGGFSVRNRVCDWCLRHEAAQRGELPEDDTQPVMTPPWLRTDFGSMALTQLFVGINIAVFVGMALAGVSITEPSSGELIRWGANFGLRTTSGEWWRLLTSTFLHIGIIHIAFNMWCLWDLGQLAESLFGKWTYALVYLTCGVGASIASVAWNPNRVSAGASGAIFGLAGALISCYYLGNFSMPRFVIQEKLRSILVFAGYNLVFGALRGRTDNSAHIGGLVVGLVFGALIAKAAPDSDEPLPRALAVLVVMLGVLGCGGWLYHAKAFERHMRYAGAFETQGKYNEAISEYQKAVEQRPDDANAHYELAGLYRRAGQPDQSKREFDMWVKISGDNERTWSELGYFYLEARDHQQARECFSRAIKLDSQSAAGHFGLGEIAGEEAKCDTAKSEFSVAASIDPGYKGGHSIIGGCMVKSGKYDEAIAEYKAALQTDDDNPVDLEYGLADAYQAKGMTKEAEAARKRAEELKASENEMDD